MRTSELLRDVLGSALIGQLMVWGMQGAAKVIFWGELRENNLGRAGWCFECAENFIKQRIVTHFHVK